FGGSGRLALVLARGGGVHRQELLEFVEVFLPGEQGHVQSSELGVRVCVLCGLHGSPLRELPQSTPMQRAAGAAEEIAMTAPSRDSSESSRLCGLAALAGLNSWSDPPTGCPDPASRPGLSPRGAGFGAVHGACRQGYTTRFMKTRQSSAQRKPLWGDLRSPLQMRARAVVPTILRLAVMAHTLIRSLGRRPAWLSAVDWEGAFRDRRGA